MMCRSTKIKKKKNQDEDDDYKSVQAAVDDSSSDEGEFSPENTGRSIDFGGMEQKDVYVAAALAMGGIPRVRPAIPIAMTVEQYQAHKAHGVLMYENLEKTQRFILITNNDIQKVDASKFPDRASYDNEIRRLQLQLAQLKTYKRSFSEEVELYKERARVYKRSGQTLVMAREPPQIPQNPPIPQQQAQRPAPRPPVPMIRNFAFPVNQRSAHVAPAKRWDCLKEICKPISLIDCMF
jgi:hypothetical protein